MPPRDLDWLLSIIRAVQAREDLERYFADGSPASTFTGRHFEALDGGGDRAGVENRITAADLVAVQMLSVVVPARTAADLLTGDLGDHLENLLRDVPVDIFIGSDAGREALIGETPANAAWEVLDKQPEVGWVTAGKLLARKRPRLIPVYDSVVRAAVGAPKPAWTWFQEQFEHEELVKALQNIAREAGVPPHLTPLRTLDVIVWMHHR